MKIASVIKRELPEWVDDGPVETTMGDRVRTGLSRA